MLSSQRQSGTDCEPWGVCAYARVFGGKVERVFIFFQGAKTCKTKHSKSKKLIAFERLELMVQARVSYGDDTREVKMQTEKPS